MAVLTFLTAPWVCIEIRNKRWKSLPLAIFFAWFAIDGSYWLYNLAMGHMMVRDANAIASTPLYFICGLIWMLNGRLNREN